MTDTTTIQRLAPQTGKAFELPAGAYLRVTDPNGEQVSDLYAVSAYDRAEHLSSGRSLDYAGKLWLTTGDVLYSNRSQPMLRIIEDTVGRHDFTLTPCSQQTFDLLYPDHEGYHPSCQQNIADALAPYEVAVDHIGVSFNIFMNVVYDCSTGKMLLGPPMSRPGDHILLRAESDLIVALTACSAENSNNGTLKPIDFTLEH
ncbi:MULTISPECIES: urea carboxylase-associated family protein [unclassified Micromonospora]|uniref:urea carboxylase-associated family protein n=1 Tax=unclassified Micromonospora TaxID=2617518 RepID=UPI0033AB38BB